MKYIFGTIAVILFFGFSLSDAQALTISPVKIEVTGDPGKTVYGEIELLNEQQEDKIFYASYENFEPSGESGSPYFVGAERGLATWIKTEPSLTLRPSEKKKVPFSITIPENTEPGGYFAAVFFGGSKPAEQGAGEVSIGGRVGTLIFLRVAGDIDESGGLLDFTAGNRRMFAELPIPFSYRVNNTGGDRIIPLGTIRVRNMFGVEVAAVSANPLEGSVLPNSIRRFETIWNGASEVTPGFFAAVKRQWSEFHIGIYRAGVDLAWGSEPTEVRNTYYFAIIPWQLLSVFTLVLILSVGGIRHYNAWIVARSKGST